AFISELFYDGRLAARPENQNQRLNAAGYLDGTGLRFLGIEHSGNQSESTEEVEAIADLIERLLRGRTTWTNKRGETLALRLSDTFTSTARKAALERDVELTGDLE